MSNAKFDAWVVEVRQAVEVLSALLAARPAEGLSDTQIRDKDGVVHDLAELVKSPCVISAGSTCFMSINDYHALNGPRWVTYEGRFYNRCEDLAKDINRLASDAVVHKF